MPMVAANRPEGNESRALSGAHAGPGEIKRILHLSVPVSATLAERNMNIGAILAINVGAILEFDVPVDAELTLYAGNRAIGRGQPIKSGENFGVRITKIDNLEHRIGAMGGSADGTGEK